MEHATIEDFVSKEDTETRFELRSIMSYSGIQVATNGHVMAFDRETPPMPNAEPIRDEWFKTIAKIYNSIADAGLKNLFIPLPSVAWIEDRAPCEECDDGKVRAEKECPECEGACEVELESEYGTTYFGIECQTCDGEGLVGGGKILGDCPHCKGTNKTRNGHLVQWGKLYIPEDHWRLIERVEDVGVCADWDFKPEFGLLLFRGKNICGSVSGSNLEFVSGGPYFSIAGGNKCAEQ